jgi:hypothetical protein
VIPVLFVKFPDRGIEIFKDHIVVSASAPCAEADPSTHIAVQCSDWGPAGVAVDLFPSQAFMAVRTEEFHHIPFLDRKFG